MQECTAKELSLQSLRQQRGLLISKNRCSALEVVLEDRSVPHIYVHLDVSQLPPILVSPPRQLGLTYAPKATKIILFVA